MVSSRLASIVESIEPTRITNRSIDGRSYRVHYFDDIKLREAGHTLYGYEYKKKIYIRNGLSHRVEQALIRHEVYHVKDTNKWFGKYGREMRANAHTALRDPLGFLATLLYSLSFARIKTYWQLYIYPRNLN